MKIDSKHKISLTGEYNAGVSDCPECGYSTSPTSAYALGVADAPNGTVLIIQCPECFTKWYFHCRDTEFYDGHYHYFVTFLEYGINHWLNPNMTEKL